MKGKISFIVPAYNAENTIKDCVKSVLAQGNTGEVIVVDDGSNDGTASILRKMKGIRLFTQKNSGPASARNRGLRAARFDYIAFVDSDVVLPRDWSAKALKLLGDRRVAGVGGPGISTDRSMVSESLDSLLYGIDMSTKRKFVDSLATMDVVYRRSAINGLEFDQTFRAAAGEDPEFNFRIRKRGHRLLFDRSLSVKHYHPTSIRALLKKWYNYGKNYMLLCSKHREMRGGGYWLRILYMPVFLALLLLSVFWLPLLALAGLQLLSLFLVYLYIGTKACRTRAMLVFPFIHTIKQISQSLGILVSMFRGRE